MSLVKFKIEIHGQLDTDDYPSPADGRLGLSIRDDVREAIESSVAVEINSIKVTGAGNKVNAEIRDQD